MVSFVEPAHAAIPIGRAGKYPPQRHRDQVRAGTPGEITGDKCDGALGCSLSLRARAQDGAAGWPEICRSNVRSPTQFGRPDVWQVAARDTHVAGRRGTFESPRNPVDRKSTRLN